MADSKVRIVEFYTLQERDLKTGDITPALIIKKSIEYIKGLPRIDRRFSINSKKFCLLESISDLKDNMQTLIFKSAKTHYRPNLLEKETLSERKNPKKAGEGEGEKTHVVIKYTDDDIFIVLEKNGLGLRIGPLVKYLKRFTKQYLIKKKKKMTFTFEYPAMAKENFLAEIKKLKRVYAGKVYVEKSILGTGELEYSSRIQQIQHDIVLNISAIRRESIKGAMEDIYHKITAPKSKISKMRVYGKNQSNGDVMIDTSFINKIEHVEADLNALTGEINTVSIMGQLKDIAAVL